MFIAAPLKTDTRTIFLTKPRVHIVAGQKKNRPINYAAGHLDSNLEENSPRHMRPFKSPVGSFQRNYTSSCHSEQTWSMHPALTQVEEPRHDLPRPRCQPSFGASHTRSQPPAPSSIVFVITLFGAGPRFPLIHSFPSSAARSITGISAVPINVTEVPEKSNGTTGKLL